MIQDGGGSGGTCGSLAKIGSGILTLQSRATNDYIADSVSLILVSGSIMNLNFSGTPDTIHNLTVNGIVQAPGVYGGPDSPAPNQLPEFAGTGTVQVTQCAPSQAGPRPQARIHISRAPMSLKEESAVYPREAKIESVPTLVPPTRSTFMATWPSASGATTYHLDVSTNSRFGSYINGYRDLNVGHVTSRIVTGLKPGTTYYYRVRVYNSQRILSNSEVKTVTTAGGLGLIIIPDYDDSITPDIEAMIERAISLEESLFNDPITVSILFRYATTQADGCSALPGGALALSLIGLSSTPWNEFVAALSADATTENDTMAIESLSEPFPSPSPQTVIFSTANGRALGLMNTPPKVCANGCVQDGCPYDGIITLNSGFPFAFTRPPEPWQYDAQRTIEHETDEVLGLGSFLDIMNHDPASPQPQDLFSWSSFGTRNLTTNGSRYFSIDSGSVNYVDFNQEAGGDFGDWLSEDCPQALPYVQNAFSCPGQVDDITVVSPEGINLDVIGYDLADTASPTPTATVTVTATPTTTASPTFTPWPRPTPPPHITPVPPPPSPRPTAWPRPTPPPHLTPVPTPSSPRPTPAPRPSPHTPTPTPTGTPSPTPTPSATAI